MGSLLEKFLVDGKLLGRIAACKKWKGSIQKDSKAASVHQKAPREVICLMLRKHRAGRPEKLIILLCCSRCLACSPPRRQKAATSEDDEVH